MVGAAVGALATIGVLLAVPAGVRPSRGVWFGALGAVGGAVVAWTLFGVPALCVAGGLAGAAVPAMRARRRREAARAAVRAAWPDALDLVLAAIRSGVAVPDAVTEPARRGPDALRPRFAEYRRRLAAGEPFERALGALEVPGDPDVLGVTAALRISARVGAADTGAVLSAISEFQRADLAQSREIAARHSWNVAAARLAVAAPWLTVAALSLQPEARVAYGSVAGTVLLCCVLALTVAAYALMRRIAGSASGVGS